MGIRAVCPNGHRLHLKAQLAGRRGLCPDCGARFRIPHESSEEPQPFAEPPKRRAKDPLGTATVSNEHDEIPLALPVNQSSHEVASVAPVEGAQVQAAATPTFEMSGVGLDEPATQTPAVGPAVSPPAADPLSESPHALWYVQPPTGGRYGPAKAEIIRQWISEGRITESCLVWRDGWPEWQSASTILGTNSSATNAGVSVDDGILPIGGPTNLRHRSKGSKGLGLSMIVILALACILLLGVLFWFINSGRISL